MQRQVCSAWENLDLVGKVNNVIRLCVILQVAHSVRTLFPGLTAMLSILGPDVSVFTVLDMAPDITDTWVLNKALLTVWFVVYSIFIFPERTNSDVDIISFELYFIFILILGKWHDFTFNLWLPLNTQSVAIVIFGTNLSPNAKTVVGGGVVSEILRKPSPRLIAVSSF